MPQLALLAETIGFPVAKKINKLIHRPPSRG
jgi:hypothetical protein